MLLNLSVHNYALIDLLELSWQPGFTTITGETGAGKSILLGALQLVLGQRADTSVLKNPDEKCWVEAVFRTEAQEITEILEANEIEVLNPCILRREILPGGRSRAFVNDCPVRLELLRDVARQLIDIHAQHDHQLIFESSFALQLLDLLANAQPKLDAYKRAFAVWRADYKALEQLQSLQKGELGDLAYQKFLFEELYEAKLKEGEYEEIETNLAVLRNAEGILQNLSEAGELLKAEPISCASRLKQSAQLIEKFSAQLPNLLELSKRLHSVALEVQDIEQDINQLADKVEHNPEELQKLEERLDLYNRLFFKHKVQSANDLLARYEELKAQLEALEGLEEKRLSAQKKAAQSELLVLELAEQLSELRKQTAQTVENEIQVYLRRLHLPHAQISLRLDATSPKNDGVDVAEFWFSANPGSALQPLKKVGSGGELSRVMLALKALTAQHKKLATILFDEIDTGVSGATAGAIAEVLVEMGRQMQVIAISHLPQMSAAGAHHLKVEKSVLSGQTTTSVRSLQTSERIDEIARQMSNSALTEAAREQAKALLSHYN